MIGRAGRSRRRGRGALALPTSAAARCTEHSVTCWSVKYTVLVPLRTSSTKARFELPVLDSPLIIFAYKTEGLLCSLTLVMPTLGTVTVRYTPSMTSYSIWDGSILGMICM
jgi:hypothetical protein